MFEFVLHNEKVDLLLVMLQRALSGVGAELLLGVAGRSVVAGQRIAFSAGGHGERGGSDWEPTDPDWAARMPGHQGTLLWTGAGMKSVKALEPVGDTLEIEALDYLLLFQNGPFEGMVPMSAHPSDGGVVLEDDSDAPHYQPITRHQREVFFVAEQDWNPMFDLLARETGMDVEHSIGGGLL